jgi:Peptidase family M1 domain
MKIKTKHPKKAAVATEAPDQVKVTEWLAIRKKTGREIDPETAEVMWDYGYDFDPYGLDPELPDEYRWVGRLYFARSPFLRMLESYLGEEDFRAGIRSYIQAHELSNTTTADLWDALAKSSKKPVAAVAASWTEQPGLPLVLVSSAESSVTARFAL